MSEETPVKIYNNPDLENNNPVADLAEASDVQYQKTRNRVWTASFQLPAGNKKNGYFDLLDFAEIYDGDRRVGLFRIDERTPVHDTKKEIYKYNCSHVLDTLNDDRVALTGKVIKSGVSTALSYILGEQDTAHWQLGTLDFSKSFDYQFSRETILKALREIPKPWWEEFQFTFNTTSYPWTINIIKPDTTPKGSLRYSKNIKSIERNENAKEMVNELYAFGKGSGSDQVTAGPFTSDPAGYGWNITDIFEKQFFDNSTDLGEAAQKYLNRVDTPKVRYKSSAVDLKRLADVNELKLGDYIRVYDPKFDLEDTIPIVSMTKQDVTGRPLELEVELANRHRKFPSYGALAFRDQATEQNLASGSVGSGGGGALKSGGVSEGSIADEAVSWSKFDTNLRNASGEQIEGNRVSVNAQTVFETDYDPETQWPSAAVSPDSARVQGYTLISGGYVKTSFLEAEFAKIDTLDLTDTTLLINAVNEGNADNTLNHEAELDAMNLINSVLEPDADHTGNHIGQTSHAAVTDVPGTNKTVATGLNEDNKSKTVVTDITLNDDGTVKSYSTDGIYYTGQGISLSTDVITELNESGILKDQFVDNVATPYP